MSLSVIRKEAPKSASTEDRAEEAMASPWMLCMAGAQEKPESEAEGVTQK